LVSLLVVKRSERLSIAIVDDDESLCRSLGRLLRAAGMQSVAYQSAEAFLDARQAPFDCLVLDVQLRGISGIELQRQLAASGERTPVIFITAHDAPEAREEALAAGCTGYFRKTDSGAEVIEAIRSSAARLSHDAK
jgi:FixJ family two-component response regulator